MASLNDVGRAPQHLNDNEKDLWREIVRDAPDDFIRQSDRFALEILVKLINRHRENMDMTAADQDRMLKLMAKFGLTPTDRKKAGAAETKKPRENPFAAVG